MKRLFGTLALCCLVAACVSDEERAVNIAASDDAACQDYGAKPGTSEYFQCRMMKDQNRQATRTALAAAILSRPAPTPYVLPMPGSN
jgi:hypothetical protein